MEQPKTEHQLPTLDEIIATRERIRTFDNDPRGREFFLLEAVAALAREVKQLKDSNCRASSK